MFNLNTPESRFAFTAVRQASLLISQVHAEVVTAMTPDDRMPVTVADFASLALVGALLTKLLPNDVLAAEDDVETLRAVATDEILAQITAFVARFQPDTTLKKVLEWVTLGAGAPSKRYWVLDPIDGTKGYLRGGQYAVALALIMDGQVQLGALGLPALCDGYRPDPYGTGSLILAARHQGAWVTSLSSPGEFERLQVSNRSNPALARIFRSFESSHTDLAKLEAIVEAMEVEPEPVGMDSQAKYAIVAAGKGEFVLRLPPAGNPGYREKIWDVAAGALIVKEAGGKVTDLQGKPLDFSTGREMCNNVGVLASNGVLHAAMLETLRSVGV